MSTERSAASPATVRASDMQLGAQPGRRELATSRDIRGMIFLVVGSQGPSGAGQSPMAARSTSDLETASRARRVPVRAAVNGQSRLVTGRTNRVQPRKPLVG